MKAYLSSILLLIVLNKHVAQDTNNTVSSNATTVTEELNETFSAIPSESPSHSPTQESTFNETETFGPETENPTFFPEEELTQSPGLQQPPQLGCQSIGIRTESDCRFACPGFSSAVQYRILPLFNATGLIRETFRGFQCQCLQAVPPVNCIYHYQFPTCRNAGVVNCRLEGFPVISDERHDKNKNYTTAQATNTNYSNNNNNNNESDANNTAVENVADTTISCAMYCRDLGFPESKDDLNDNGYNSLCTHHDSRDWTSCACGVIISLNGGRSVSIEDGMYVCGDTGFEDGLNFDATISNGAKVLMGSHYQWLRNISVFAGILVLVNL